jgi:hypothetical protein
LEFLISRSKLTPRRFRITRINSSALSTNIKREPAMNFNVGKSILGTGESRVDLEREADVIFTAAFIGATHFQNDKNDGRTWRIVMEPSTDGDKDRETRTADDRESMKALNDACSKINHVMRSLLREDAGGVSWCLSPTFDRGGMILAGELTHAEYSEMSLVRARKADRYLTASQRIGRDDRRKDEAYVRRDAYGGLIMDDGGNAVTAIGTVRTSLNPSATGAEERRPSMEAAARASQYPKELGRAAWGIIRDVTQQATLQQEGMHSFSQLDGIPVAHNKDTDIVECTHGMIPSFYETARIAQGTAFEMSIGEDKFKLASCMSCSSFVIANGLDGSSTQQGRGESWASDCGSESHDSSQHSDNMSIGAAIDQCNTKHAKSMHDWMMDGVTAMLNGGSWVNMKHVHALKKLRDLLEEESTSRNTVARDLYLDAITYRKSDLQRVNSALVYGDSPRKRCDGAHDWSEGRVSRETWKNPLTDEEVAASTYSMVPPRP